MELLTKLRTYVAGCYRPEEYPALSEQLETWGRTRPLAGLPVLDGTPVFRNTLTKYLPLLAAGAELTVATSDRIPFDPAVVEQLAAFGLKHVHNCRARGAFALILDCGGVYAELEPRLGFVELTRSGAYRFEHCDRPVILVDDSRIKTIETCLGTGDGFLRAMAQLGYGRMSGRRVVIFGYGKVGRGVAYYAQRAGALVTAVDDPERVQTPPAIPLIDRRNTAAVLSAVRDAWCVVSVTGIAGALADPELAATLNAGTQLIANMGVEDEFGPLVPASRVLCAKRPLNFVLAEPTQLRYLDPTMALHNAAAAVLAESPQPPGLRPPDEALVCHYWAVVERDGLIAGELAGAGLQEARS